MKYLIFSDQRFNSALEEMASNMFHGGFLTRRAMGDPIAEFESEDIESIRDMLFRHENGY